MVKRTIYSRLGQEGDMINIKLKSLNKQEKEEILAESVTLDCPIKTGQPVTCGGKKIVKEKVLSIKIKDGEPTGNLFQIETANSEYEVIFL